MPATPSREEAVAYVYSLITGGEAQEARDAAQAILLLDQADGMRQDIANNR